MAAAGAYDEIEKVTANCNLQDILQQASTLGTQSDKALVYYSDGSAEVHHSENCYDNDIFNMFTQEEQYTKLLEPIPELHQVQQNDSNVISAVSSMVQNRGTVEQHPANIEETRVLYDSLYNNLAIEVEKVSKEKSTISFLQEERKKLKNDFKTREDELLDKQIQLENKIKEIDNILVKTDEIFPIVNQVDAREQNFEIQFLKEAAKFVRDFKSLAKEADESIAKQKALELEIERLLREVVSQDIMSIVRNPSVVDTSNLQTELEPYNDMQQKIERLQAQLGDQKGKSKDTPCVSDTLDPLSQKLENENNLFDSIKVTRAQTKAIIDSLQDKLHDTIYENAKLRAQLFDKVSEQKDTNKGTSVNTQFSKQSILGKPPSSSEPKLYSVTPFPKSTVIPKVGKSNALSKPVTSNLAPSSRESFVVNNKRVIALEIFRINPFKASRVDNFVPNKHVKASFRTKPITISQPHVVTKEIVNSNRNGFSPNNVESTTRTRRPQPRNNPKNDRAPSKSKSSCLSNKIEKKEENYRSLQSSNYPNHTSSECNNIKLAIRTEKSEKNQSANVSKSDNQKKQKANVKKSKTLSFEDRLASSRPSKPRTCLKWLPTGRIFDLYGKITSSSNTESESDTSVFETPEAEFMYLSASCLLSSSRNGFRYDSHDVNDKSWKVYSVICSTNCSNGENQVVSKSSAVATADASDKRQ
ncbi:hypothetical protein Tco_1002496 [Tanacetum coccineum]|uniref:Uncharacterized protein n=1 Tax=Tanacetum coccineum TaxID=301880 RepID=A0ABQ5F6G6_9ASTR